MAGDNPHARDLKAAIEWIAHLEHENAILRDTVHCALDALHAHVTNEQRRSARMQEMKSHVEVIGRELQAFRAEARRQADGA